MKSEIVDLTHLVNSSMTVYPDTVKPAFELYNSIEEDGFAELKMTFCTHTGTHIDAPCHILKNRKSLDQFKIDKFIGKAIVIPCKDLKEISIEYLEPFKEKILQIEFILFYTGWQFKWNSVSYFEDFPVLTKEAAEWLATFRLKGIGFDTISADGIVMLEKNSSVALQNHHVLLGKEIIIIENLNNLDKLPDSVFTFQCMPLKVENADGSPVRAFAVIEYEIGVV
jgi:arylformamidase